MIGRFWALLGSAAIGVVSAAENRYDVDDWWVGLFWGGVSALGVAGGLALRRFANRSGNLS